MFDFFNIAYDINWNVISFNHFLEVSLIVAMIGMLGILSNKRMLLLSVISIELMFYGLNFNLISTSLYLDDILGQIFSLFVLTLAAAESALALALIVAYFRIFWNILINLK